MAVFLFYLVSIKWSFSDHIIGVIKSDQTKKQIYILKQSVFLFQL